MDALNEQQINEQITEGAADVAQKVLNDMHEGMRGYTEHANPDDPDGAWATWLTGFEVGLHYAMHGLKDTLRLAVMIDLAVHDGNTDAHRAAEALADIVDLLVIKHATTSAAFAKAGDLVKLADKKDKDDA